MPTVLIEAAARQNIRATMSSTNSFTPAATRTALAKHRSGFSVHQTVNLVAVEAAVTGQEPTGC